MIGTRIVQKEDIMKGVFIHEIDVDAARARVLDDRYVQQLEEELAEMKNMNKKLKAQVIQVLEGQLDGF